MAVPACDLSSPSRPPPSLAAAGTGTEPGGAPGDRARVLIVEDDYFVGLDHEHVLSNAGYSVQLATSGDAALEAARERKPDLVLMDINLGSGPDGIAVAERLLAELGVRCLYVSAYSDAAVRKRAEATRPLGWLPKPFAAQSLQDAVRKALSELDQL